MGEVFLDLVVFFKVVGTFKIEGFFDQGETFEIEID